MKTMNRWMSVMLAGLPLLTACGGAELDSMEQTSAAEELGQRSDAIYITSSTHNLPARGAGGGTTWGTTRCPSGYVAVGLYGRSGWFLDQVGLVCQTLNSNGSLSPYNQVTTSAVGGPNGNPFQFTCPVGQAIVGFHGYSGQYPESVGIHCATPYNWLASASVEYSSSLTSSQYGTSFFNDKCATSAMVTSITVKYGGNLDLFQGSCSFLSW